MSTPPPISMSLPAQPVAAADRIGALDGVRGFALLGIFLMNIEAFNGPMFLSSAGIDPRWQGADRWLDALIYVIVQGSFFPLFSLLFGMGYALMAQRLQGRDVRFVRVHLRRMACLLVIGLLHGVLVWSGDVLLMYALLGLLLPAFDVLPRRWLAAAGTIGILLAVTGMLVLAGLMALLGAVDGGQMLAGQSTVMAAEINAQVQAYGPQGSYVQAVLQRVSDMVASLQGLVVMGPDVLGLFLLGVALVRSGAVHDRVAHARLWAGLRWGAWPLGVLLSLSMALLSPFNPPTEMGGIHFVAQAGKLLAGALMGLGWLAWGLQCARLLAPLAPAGRMSLTTYLGQSVVGTLCFYGYGWGWFGRFSRLEEVLFVVVVFTGQVVFAAVWLRHFRQGPVEWLWRAGTYGRLPPLRR